MPRPFGIDAERVEGIGDHDTVSVLACGEPGFAIDCQLGTVYSTSKTPGRLHTWTRETTGRRRTDSFGSCYRAAKV